MKIKIITFGFKYGRPPCNHFIDISWIPNPWRHPGENPKEVVFSTPGVTKMLNILVAYIKCVGSKDRMIFGIGCSSGRDRSPLIANELKKLLTFEGIEVEIEHRDKLK